MTKDEALKLALEALEADELDMVDDGSGNMVFRKEQAITAIKEALAQPEQIMQDSTCSTTLRLQGKPYPRTCKKCGLGPCIAQPSAQPEQEPVAWEQFYPDIGKPQIAINSEIVGYVAPQLKIEGSRHVICQCDKCKAQPEQEPLAWISTGPARMIHWTADKPAYGDDWVPLYTTLPQRKPLTDEEIWKFWWSRPEVQDGEDDSMEAEFVAAVRAVLAAHGIKEKNNV